MSAQAILHVKFVNTGPPPPDTELEKYANAIASEVPGLLAKYFISKDGGQVQGGVYVFDTRAAAGAYLDGPIVKGLKSNPHFRNFQFEIYDVAAQPSRITRAPFT